MKINNQGNRMLERDMILSSLLSVVGCADGHGVRRYNINYQLWMTLLSAESRQSLAIIKTLHQFTLTEVKSSSPLLCPARCKVVYRVSLLGDNNRELISPGSPSFPSDNYSLRRIVINAFL